MFDCLSKKKSHSTVIISPLYYISIEILQLYIPLLNNMLIYICDGNQSSTSIIEILGNLKPTYLVSLPSFYNDIYSYHNYTMNSKTVYNIMLFINSLLKRNIMKKSFPKH